MSYFGRLRNIGASKEKVTNRNSNAIEVEKSKSMSKPIKGRGCIS